MSLLAKILIVVQAVLVFTYFGVSASLFQHSRDWRTSYAKLKNRYGQLARVSASKINKSKAVFQEKQKFLNDKEGEKASLQRQLDNAKEDRQGVAGKLSESEERYRQFLGQQQKLETTYNNLQNEARSRREKIDRRKNELKENLRRRTVAEKQIARLQIIAHSLEDDVREIGKEYSDVRSRLRDKSLLIAMAQEKGLDFSTLLASPPTKLIKSRVAAVKNDLNPALIVIGVGSDDSVEIGYTFSVIRRNQFIAKLLVESVKSSYSACRIKFAAEGQSIEPGDVVTTRLP